MFKRSGAIVLTVLYLITVVGFALNLHYCGKIITAVKIDAPVKGCLSNLMNRKMKCCTDKQIDVKIKDAHQTKSVSVLGKLFSWYIVKAPFARVDFHVQTLVGETAVYRGPPDFLSSKNPIYIRNSVFLI